MPTTEIQKEIAVTVFLDAGGNIAGSLPVVNSEVEYEVIQEFLQRVVSHEDATPDMKIT